MAPTAFVLECGAVGFEQVYCHATGIYALILTQISMKDIPESCCKHSGMSLQLEQLNGSCVSWTLDRIPA